MSLRKLKKAVLVTVGVVVGLLILLRLVGLLFSFATVGVKATFGYVSYEGFELQLSDAETGRPLSDAEVHVTWRACKYIVFDCLAYDLGEATLHSETSGACPVPPFSRRGKAKSLPDGIVLTVDKQGYIPEPLRLPEESRPAPGTPRMPPAVRGLWDADSRTWSLAMVPSHGVLPSNQIAALGADDRWLWVATTDHGVVRLHMDTDERLYFTH